LHRALSPQATTNAGSGGSDTAAALSPTASTSQWFAAIDDDDDDDTGRTDEGSAATAAEMLSNHLDSRSPSPPPPQPPPPPSSSRPPPPSSMRAPSYRRTQGIMSTVDTQRKRRRQKAKGDSVPIRSRMQFGTSQVKSLALVVDGDDNDNHGDDVDDKDDADDDLILDSDDEIERMFESDSEDDDVSSADVSAAIRGGDSGASDGRYVRLNRRLKGIAGAYGNDSAVAATSIDDADYNRDAAGGCCCFRCGNGGGCSKRILGDPHTLAKTYFRFSQAELFHMRLGHSLLILAAITYLKLTTLALQTVYCVDVRDGDGVVRSRLKVELATVCFEGPHFYAAIFTCAVMIPFALLFPVYLFFRLKRNFHSSEEVLRKTLFARIERYGLWFVT
jgi:hypothetical protein